MTNYCCQVCVLSRMLIVLPPRLPAVCMVSGNLNTTWFDLNTPTGQHGKWYEKYSLHLIFTFYLNRDTSVTELFTVVEKKKKYPCWLIYRQWIETVSYYGRKIRNDVDTDTLLQTRIRIMTINQHNSVLHAFSVPNWSQICGVVEVLTVLLLSPTR